MIPNSVKSRNPHDHPNVHLDGLVVGGALEGLGVDGDGDGEALPPPPPTDKPAHPGAGLMEISFFLFDQF